MAITREEFGRFRTIVSKTAVSDRVTISGGNPSRRVLELASDYFVVSGGKGRIFWLFDSGNAHAGIRSALSAGNEIKITLVALKDMDESTPSRVIYEEDIRHNFGSFDIANIGAEYFDRVYVNLRFHGVAADTIGSENVGTANGTRTTFSGTLANRHFISRITTYQHAGSTVTGFSVSGPTGDVWNISASALTTGTVNRLTGAYNFVWASAPSSGALTLGYQFVPQYLDNLIVKVVMPR